MDYWMQGLVLTVVQLILGFMYLPVEQFQLVLYLNLGLLAFILFVSFILASVVAIYVTAYYDRLLDNNRNNF